MKRCYLIICFAAIILFGLLSSVSADEQLDDNTDSKLNEKMNLWSAIKEKSGVILLAPYLFPEMIWIAAPLLIILIIMEFYFSKYSKEELGWNTAVSNSLILIFVSIDLLRHLYEDKGDIIGFFYDFPLNISGKAFIALFVFLLGFWLFYNDYYHLMSKQFSFTISSELFLNLLAYLAIISVYSDILFPETRFNYLVTGIAMLIVFTSLLTILTGMRIVLEYLFAKPSKNKNK